MDGILSPVVNLEELQQKANEAAQKAALKEIDDFYNGYDSPYRKTIKEHLKNKAVDHAFDLPDIVSVVNEKISAEVDRIANTAISKTFLPMVTEMLTRAEPEIKFSDILRKFIEKFYDKDDHDTYDFSVDKKRDDGSFSTYEITGAGKTYDINIYNNREGRHEIYTLPFRHSIDRHSQQVMKLSLDGATLEMPFVKGVLDDPFLSYIATIVMANSNIIMDTTEFDDDMFPHDECYCH